MDCNCYNCLNRNPCTNVEQNIANDQFYFSHEDTHKFVQCSTDPDQCFEVPCQDDLVWDCVQNACNYPPPDGTVCSVGTTRPGLV